MVALSPHRPPALCTPTTRIRMLIRTPGRVLRPTVGTASVLSSCVALALAMPVAHADDPPATDSANPVLLPKVTVKDQAPDANPDADPDAPYKIDRLSSSKFTQPVL